MQNKTVEMSIFLIYGQTQGIVLDSENKPLVNVSVFFIDQNILLVTNEKGIFYFDEEILNTSYIHFYKLGYASKVVQYQQKIPLKIILDK